MVNSIQNNGLTYERLVEDHKKVFSCLGKPGKHFDITIKKDLTPVVHSARKVPI